MNLNHLIPILISTLLCGNMMTAQTTEPKTTQIVFIPNRLGNDQTIHQNFKENDFYWWNATDNIKAGPTIETENEMKFIRIKGNQPRGNNKDQSYLDITRIFTVTTNSIPKNPTTATTQPKPSRINATITLKIRWSHDPWSEIQNQPNYTHISYLLGADDKQLNKTEIGTFASNTGVFQKEYEEKWIEKSINVELTKNTKFIRIHAAVDNSTQIDIADIEVSFK